MRTANAGCIAPIVRRGDGTVQWISVGGLPLGLGLGRQTGYEEISLDLYPGDLVILISDGAVEAHNTQGQMFGFERLEQVIAGGPASSAEAMLAHLKAQLAAFVGEREPHDDTTMIVIQV